MCESVLLADWSTIQLSLKVIDVVGAWGGVGER